MSEMNVSTRANLCKGLRACGIPKNQSHEIVNLVCKWYRENGAEWTNSRIKDLRQWYETTLAGDPKVPSWFAHTKEGLPKGIWNWVFKLKPAKALGVLSLNTVFYEDKFSETQKEKFLHGLAGSRSQNPDYIRFLIDRWRKPLAKARKDHSLNLPRQRKDMPEIRFPTLFDMNGSIPVHEGRESVRPNESLGLALKALRLSWESVPQVTFDFLDRQDLLGYMPMSVIGNEVQLDLNRPHERNVGRVSVLQQPQLKARTVGNPNRVTQVTLEPLKEVFMASARKLPTDCTFDQESGVQWVQHHLRLGNELAGSDLTSASDLLDVELCLDLVDMVFGFPEINGYADYRRYFIEVSRSNWWCPALNREVKWEQGNVLGTGPSFGLLTLTNNAAGLLATLEAVYAGAINPSTFGSESFRVVGDDIVMRSELEPYYTRIICALGGEINHSKTIKSNKVAEFAGRVITSDKSYLKAIKYSEPSDSSFMSYVAQLGDQAKYLLRPKQFHTYQFYRYVPGIFVPGPWMQDSYGVPLGPRYSWYLTEVEPALSRVEPDLESVDYDLLLLKAELSLAEAGEPIEERSLDQPFIDDGYLPSQVQPSFKVGGDPRLTKGKTTLQVLKGPVEDGQILPFETWLEENSKLGGGESPATSPSNSSEPSEEEATDIPIAVSIEDDERY